MKHQFQRLPIPEGERSVVEICPCGCISKRYLTGTRLYQQWDGVFRSDAVECKLVAKMEAPDAEIKAAAARVIPIRDDADLRAQLKDAYIIINLLYEEAVTAGLRTPGRAMAGRLLYSAGYGETVKQIENQ